jgi:hypothetical protein
VGRQVPGEIVATKAVQRAPRGIPQRGQGCDFGNPEMSRRSQLKMRRYGCGGQVAFVPLNYNEGTADKARLISNQ